jgi:hypothetical protein
MADFVEKKTADTAAHEVPSDDNSQEGTDNLHVEILKGSEALAAAIRKEDPSPWTPALWKLYGFCALAFLCSTMNG